MGVSSNHAHRAGSGRRRIIKALVPLIFAMSWPLVASADDISGWGPQQRARSLGPSISIQGAAAAAPKPLDVEAAAAETIALTNAFRRRNGLPDFALDPVCQAAAFDHARDMARRGYLDHFGPDGSSPTSRYSRRNTAGQRVIRVTENIAWGNGTTPERALKMWLGSSGHRKHLIGTEMTHIGVGVADGSCLLGPCTYFVQCFARRP